MNLQDRLQEATIEALSRKDEASYSRIYQHTQDDSTFAIIGSEDKDTKQDRSTELYNIVRDYTYKRGKAIGFNKVNGTYTYQKDDNSKPEKQTAYEKSLILYDIDKQTALDIANEINQESIIWKDPNFFGLLYADGSVMGEFDNKIGNNMNFSGAEDKGFGTQLPKDRKTKLGFTFEGVVKYPQQVIKKSPNTRTDETLEEQFVFYSK